MWLKVHFWRHAELLVIHMQPFLILIHLRKQTHFCKQSRKVGLLRWYSLMPETHFISTTSYIMLYLYPKRMKGYSFIYRGLNHCYPCLIKGLELLHPCFHISLDRPSFCSLLQLHHKKTLKFWRRPWPSRREQLHTSYSRQRRFFSPLISMYLPSHATKRVQKFRLLFQWNCISKLQVILVWTYFILGVIFR